MSSPISIKTLMLPFSSKVCPQCKAEFHEGLSFCFIDGCRLRTQASDNKIVQSLQSVIVCIDCASASEHKADCPRNLAAQLSFIPAQFNQQVTLPYNRIGTIATSELAVIDRATLNDGRPVIIKLFRSEPDDKQLSKRLERFLRLIPLHIKMQNPHIEQMIGYGQLPNTVPYLLFEPTLGNLSLQNLHGLFSVFPANFLISVFSIFLFRSWLL